MDSSIAHAHYGRKGNKLKRRREPEREARQNVSEIKKEVRLEVKIIAKQVIILILSSSLAYSMLCIS